MIYVCMFVANGLALVLFLLSWSGTLANWLELFLNLPIFEVRFLHIK
uniref:Uncharacterized protein n=1 Tax=Rhizophora mucronata TaxID=61149 RepID=A0A2P2JGY3_RHIMU